jgi:hypothetical protein
MGQTKKLYEQMTLDEMMGEFFNHLSGDEDYQYERYREQQEAEYSAYEEMLGDR